MFLYCPLVLYLENDVPSLTRHKNGLPGSLEDLQRCELWRPVRLLCSGIDHVEPGDSLVLLVAPVLSGHLDQLAGRVSGEQTPPLVSLNQGVPGAGAQRVDVDAGPGARRAHHKPPIRINQVNQVTESLLFFWSPHKL